MSVTLPEASLMAFVLALATTPAAGVVARRLGAVARPRDDRWHRREVPLLGGVGIAIPTLAVTLLGGVTGSTAIVLAVATAMFGVGLYDDLRPLRPSSKLVLQIVLALGLAFGLPDVSLTGERTLDVLLITIWLVAITNAINLLDNMDGLASGIVLIALGFAMGLGWPSATPERLCLMGALAGALAGFLVYNFNPAGIFMGDSGSLFIGLLLASVALPDGNRGPVSLVAIVSVPAVLLAIPILDTALVSVVRVLSRRRISTGGRDHTSHRLVAIGLSERAAVVFLYGLAAAAGVVAVMLDRSTPVIGAAIVIAFAVGLALFAIYIAQVRVYDEGQFSSLVGRSFTPLLASLTFKRRIFEVVLDLLLIWVAYTTAFGLRFEGEVPDRFAVSFVESMPVVVAAKLLGLWLAGAYSGVWRFLSIPDLLVYVRATLFGSVLAVLAVTWAFRFESFSRGVFVIDALVLFLLVVGSRLSFRLLRESLGTNNASSTPVLIYGAGKAGVLLLREVSSNDALGLRAVGLLDDDPNKRGQRVLGCPVLGALDQVEQILTTTRAEQVIVSTHAISPERLTQLDAVCQARQVRVRRMSFVIE